MKYKVLLLAVLALLGGIVGYLKFFSNQIDLPGKEEFVLCYNSAAEYDIDSESWKIPISGRIFKPKKDSTWRNIVNDIVASSELISDDEDGDNLLRDRLSDFLADNKRQKKLMVNIAGSQFNMEPSSRDGVFVGTIKLPGKLVEQYCKGSNLEYTVVTAPGDKREFSGNVSLVKSGSVCVISDIDDTIKVSNVNNKTELMKNVFSRPYKATDGMPEYYRKLSAEGANFFYVSASPVQLYRPLYEFMKECGYPKGSITLRDFYAKDMRLFNMLQESGEVKKPAIEKIIEQFADCSFILIGDSGEQDAAIYGELARKYPGRVKQILIRCVRELNDEELNTLRLSAGKLPQNCEFRAFEQP